MVAVVDPYHQVVVVVTDTFLVVIVTHFHVPVRLFAVVVVILLTHAADREAIHLVAAAIHAVAVILADVAIHAAYPVEEVIHPVVVIQEAEAMIAEIIHRVARAEASLLLLLLVVEAVEASPPDVDSYIAMYMKREKEKDEIVSGYI